MSGLTYSGVGLVVLTAAGLVVKALHQSPAGTPGRGRVSPVADGGDGGCWGTLGSAPVTVAVVVPAHNEAATIEQTVRSCWQQTYPVAQVIVVADNCTDATAELARSVGAMVIEGCGGSKAAAQNLALPQVTAEVVVALDGDNTLDAQAVAHLVATMRAGYAGTCAAVLPKDTTTIFSQYRTLYHALANGWTKKIQDVLGRQLVLNGMANCHRTDVLTSMGGFPDDSVTEDFNLTWALHRRGYAVAFTPEALVYTQEPTSFRELVGQMHRWTAGFAQCMVAHRAPLVDWASFLVVVSLAGDAVVGGTGHGELCAVRDSTWDHGVLAVVGLAVDRDLRGQYRGGYPPAGRAYHAALCSGLVFCPDPHRSNGHLVAGAGMGAGSSLDDLDRPARTPTHPDPDVPPPQNRAGRGRVGWGGALCSAPHPGTSSLWGSNIGL